MCKKFLPAVDNSETPEIPSFSMLFRRLKPETKAIPIHTWLWLVFVEICFGTEILESFTTTASASSNSALGWEATLNRHIPKGFIIDRFRPTLVSVLYYKHYLQYCILRHTNPITIESEEKHLELSYVNFAIRKSILYQLIYFRRVYFFLFIASNFALNITIFLFSDSITAAVIGFFVIHFGKAAKA